MSLREEFQEYLAQNRMTECDVVLIAVSGGPDSMCLLHLFLSLREQMPELIVLHLNHGLRGRDSDDEEEALRLFCVENQVPYISRKIDLGEISKAKGLGLEEAGRNERYAFFDEIAREYESKDRSVRVAVAHQREDRAETLLMNLFRGTGLDGLCALKPIRDRVIRPLLFASREQIESYVKEQGIMCFIDQTNLQSDFSRNRWRNTVLPEIREVSVKDPVEALISTAELLCADKEYMDERVDEIFNRFRTEIRPGIYGIPRRVITENHVSIASRLVRRLFREAFGSMTDLSRERVEQILSAAHSIEGNRTLSVPGDRHVGFFSDYLFFRKNSELCHENDSIEKGNESDPFITTARYLGKDYFLFGKDSELSYAFQNRDIDKTIEIGLGGTENSLLFVRLKTVENPARVVYNNRTWYCPVSEIDRLVLRSPRPADYVRPAGQKGGKPLRRFLTDRKVPPEIRGRLLLFAKEEEVLWIPGMVHAKGFVDEVSRLRFEQGKKPEASFGTKEKALCGIEILDKTKRTGPVREL